MDKCRKYRDIFIDALYNGLSPEKKQDFDTHLKTCPECATAFSGLGMTLGVMDQRQRSEPDPVFWSGYWDRLVPRLEEKEKTTKFIPGLWRRLTQIIILQPNWAIGTAAAVGLLLIGVFIGKLVFSPIDSGQQISGSFADASSEDAKMVSLESRTGQYLRRSKVLLLGLINFDSETEDSYALDLTHQKEISQELVHEASFLKNELQNSARMQLLQLITDLEVILLQIANLESEHDLSAIEMVKSGVDSRGVLLKINLQEMRQVKDTIRPTEDSNKSKEISI